jgi:hypothetical protein
MKLREDDAVAHAWLLCSDREFEGGSDDIPAVLARL